MKWTINNYLKQKIEDHDMADEAPYKSTLAKDTKILLTKVANFYAFLFSTSSASQLSVNKASSSPYLQHLAPK